MLRIRPDQFEILSQEAFARQLELWAEEFRADLSEGKSAAELPALLAAGSQAAAGYGLTQIHYLRDYLELLVRFGATPEGAPSEPRLREILEQQQATEIAKMDRVAALLEELDPSAEPDEDADWDDTDEGDMGDSGMGDDEDEPGIRVDERFDVPADPEEMDLDGVDDEEAW